MLMDGNLILSLFTSLFTSINHLDSSAIHLGVLQKLRFNSVSIHFGMSNGLL